jgi:hypothetical protein
MKGLGTTRPPANHWPWTRTDIASEKEWKEMGFDDGMREAYAQLGSHCTFPTTYGHDGRKKDGGNKRAAPTTKTIDKRAAAVARKSSKESEKGGGKGSPGRYSPFSVRPSAPLCDHYVTCGSH